MVRGSQGFVRLALSAAALFWAQDLMAASYELEASGRDEAAALGNLKMTAVRESVKSVLSPEELKSHAGSIRSEIFLKVNELAVPAEGIRYRTENGKVIASGTVEVRDEEILDRLGRIPELNEAVSARRQVLSTAGSADAGTASEEDSVTRPGTGSDIETSPETGNAGGEPGTGSQNEGGSGADPDDARGNSTGGSGEIARAELESEGDPVKEPGEATGNGEDSANDSGSGMENGSGIGTGSEPKPDPDPDPGADGDDPGSASGDREEQSGVENPGGDVETGTTSWTASPSDDGGQQADPAPVSGTEPGQGSGGGAAAAGASGRSAPAPAGNSGSAHERPRDSSFSVWLFTLPFKGLAELLDEAI